MTADTNQVPDEDRLFRAASAVLGGKRAAQLRDALADRAGQFTRVSRATTAPRQPPAAGPVAAPGRASIAEWQRRRRRIRELDEYLRAWAWQAPAAPEGAPRGDTASALDGLVIGVKDVIDVAGMPTRAGAPRRRPDPVPADAPAVARLRAAGAVVAGKTQCTQWALNDPAPTRNPWNHDRTPGGSSAGSGAAVAAGMCTATVDTQTAGDVLRPAAYTGTVGFKPSIGWVTTDGSVPVAPSIDTLGVIARQVGDAAAVAAAIADEPQRFSSPGMPTAPRIGVLVSDFTADTGQAVRENLRQVLGQLAAAGADLPDVQCPVDLPLVHAAHRVITFAECAAGHLPGASPGGYGPRAQELIDLGSVTPAHVYLHAQRVRRDATRRLAAMFADVDAIALPVVPEPAPARDTTGDSRFQIPWTLCGFPALSLPTGLSPDGLPLAMQLIGGLHHEQSLLAAGRWSERVLGLKLAGRLDNVITEES